MVGCCTHAWAHAYSPNGLHTWRWSGTSMPDCMGEWDWGLHICCDVMSVCCHPFLLSLPPPPPTAGAFSVVAATPEDHKCNSCCHGNSTCVWAIHFGKSALEIFLWLLPGNCCYSNGLCVALHVVTVVL